MSVSSVGKHPRCLDNFFQLCCRSGVTLYSKNQCPWEIRTISNEAGGGVIRHEAVRLSGGSCLCRRAFIPWPNCEIFIRIQSIFAAENAPNKPRCVTNRRHKPGEHTHTRAYALFRPAAITHDPQQNTTHWSVWVMSELYYVLPRLHLCHFCQIIQVNSTKKRLKSREIRPTATACSAVLTDSGRAYALVTSPVSGYYNVSRHNLSALTT